MIRSGLAMTLAVASPANVCAADVHRGGTLHLTASSGVDTLDPQISYNSQSTELFASVYDGLVTFPKQAGLVEPVAAMNTRQPPFDRLAARQAVNLAVDRRAAVLFMGGSSGTGTGAMLPACTMLPRGIAGHVTGCPSLGSGSPDRLRPDIAHARALVVASGTRGMRVVLVVNASRNEDALGENIRETLSRIGWDAQVRSITPAVQFNYIQNSANKVQISLTGWDADYPGPADYLQVLFGCRNIHPGSNSSINISGFCDPVVQAMFDGANATLDSSARAALWSAIDRRIMEQSPAAPLVQRRYVDFVSQRLGHYVYAGIYHMLFSQVWVQ